MRLFVLELDKECLTETWALNDLTYRDYMPAITTIYSGFRYPIIFEWYLRGRYQYMSPKLIDAGGKKLCYEPLHNSYK